MVKPTNTKFDFPLQKKLNEISSGVGGGGGGGVTDHGALTGLADDDHLLYHTDTRGDTRYYTKSQVDTSLSGKANTGHTHVTSEVTGLDTALSGKQPLATVLTNTTAAFTTAQETKLAGIASGAQVNVPTNLSYTDATRVLASDTGTDVTLPLVTTGNAGLAPASGGGTANFLRADGTWATPSGGGGINNHGYSVMVPATGLFISNNVNGTALGTQIQVANRNVIAPFIPGFNVTIDQLGVSVSTLLASNNAKGVIYDADSNGRPTTILRESTNISSAAASTVFAAITSITLTAGKVYWIGVRCSGTFTLRTLAVGALPALDYTNAATPAIRQTLILTETFANAAANWTYASSQHSTALMPLVLMRVA